MKRSPDPDLQLLAALADPVRFTIVRRLAGCDGICACDFTDATAVSQPTVSHHLRVLREAGVVSSQRRGSQIYYRLDPAAIGRLSGIVQTLFPGNFVPARDLALRPSGAAPISLEVPRARP